MLDVTPFLTAYDPSDLPGGSLDPLGFDRGYQYLAESLLPGLTNVASFPRYFCVLCTALAISDAAASGSETARDRLTRRRNAVQHLERLWALGCVLAAQGSEGELPASGIRGLRYVEREIERMGTKADATLGDYKLLARQVQYGLLGIYSSVAERLHLVEGELDLHPELGRQLAAAFEAETQLPKAIRKCLLERRPIDLHELAAWGERSHHSRAGGPREAAILRSAFDLNPTRSRLGQALSERPREPEESELNRLGSVCESLRGDPAQSDLSDALAAADAYERCFRANLLVFQSLIWNVQRSQSLDLSAAGGLPAVQLARKELSAAAPQLDFVLSGSYHLRSGEPRWRDALAFVKAAAQEDSAAAFVHAVLVRHRDVQQGKLDRGRRKTPWLELRGATIHLTLSEAPTVSRDPTDINQVAAHEYRTRAADRLIGRGAA